MYVHTVSSISWFLFVLYQSDESGDTSGDESDDDRKDNAPRGTLSI